MKINEDISNDPGLLEKNRFSHWFVAVVLPIIISITDLVPYHPPLSRVWSTHPIPATSEKPGFLSRAAAGNRKQAKKVTGPRGRRRVCVSRTNIRELKQQRRGRRGRP